MYLRLAAASFLLLPLVGFAAAEPTDVPQSAAELWAEFAPDGEPLRVEVLDRWEDDRAVLRYVRYHVGTLQGSRTTARPRMAAYFGLPKGAKNVPAVLHLHGGGQRANRSLVHYWNTLGYAALSINWGEKPVEGDDAPNTDWDGLAAGFLDPAHHNDASPGEATLYDVPHPANSSWYLCAYAARRGLTFLAEQPEVDPERLGLSGHSMGGRLTVLTAVDPRVRAAIPSVGGSGFLYDDLWGIPDSARRMRADLPLYNRTIDCRAYWPQIQCPVLFLGATNDFNSPTELVVRGLGQLRHDRWRLVLAPHKNHRFTDETYVARPLWFETHLKRDFEFPAAARTELVLETGDGVPVLRVWPDESSPHAIERVDVYYGFDRDPRCRYWRDARAERAGDHWEGRLSVFDVDEPLFAFANVTYRLSREIAAPPGHAPRIGRLALTGQYRAAYPQQLKTACVAAVGRPRRIIDDFERGWHDWRQISAGNRHHWYFGTHKIADPAWVGPKGGSLAFDVHATEPNNRLGVVIETDAWRGYTRRPRDRFVAVMPLPKAGWTSVELAAEDFENAEGKPLGDWHRATELAFKPANKVLEEEEPAEHWNGEVPRFRNLRWVGGEFQPRPKPYRP